MNPSETHVFSGLSSVYDYHQLFTDGFETIPNTETTAKILGRLYNTTRSFQALDVSVRKCRFPWEQDDPSSMFSKYSASGCRLMCAFRESAEQTGCVPWYLSQDLGDWPMCDGYNTLRFKKKVGNPQK